MTDTLGLPLFDPCFTIQCERAGIVPLPASKVPGGTRLRVSYRDGVVKPLKGTIVPEIRGLVLSGGDWILVREDGVALFDMRLTLGSHRDDVVVKVDDRSRREFNAGTPPPKNDFLLNALVTGMAPLGGSDGEVKDGAHPVALPVVFEGAGPLETWTKPRFRELSATYPEYAKLLAHQCLASGAITIEKGQVVGLKLDIYALRAAAPSDSR